MTEHSTRCSIRDDPIGHGNGCVDGSYMDWHQRHVVRVFSALSSGCLVYRALVAALVAQGLASRLGC